MGVVSRDNLKTALIYLSETPHPVAVHRKKVMDAEHAMEALEAKLFLEKIGTIKEREMWVEMSQEYQAAKKAVSDATMKYLEQVHRRDAANTLISIYQTESKNEREFDRGLRAPGVDRIVGEGD